MLFYIEGQGVQRPETIADEILSHTEPEPGWLVGELLIYFPDLIRRIALQARTEQGRTDLELRDEVLRRPRRNK